MKSRTELALSQLCEQCLIFDALHGCLRNCRRVWLLVAFHDNDRPVIHLLIDSRWHFGVNQFNDRLIGRFVLALQFSKRDIDVTEEDMAAYSLILYGGPEENAVTAALIPDLPLEITPDAVSVDGVRFEARDAAVGLVCPNPRNPNRYVLVKAATSALGLYHLNQIPNEYDFAIVDGRAPAEGETGEVWVAAGRFDRNWRLDERYVVRGDEEARSRATVTGVPVDGQ